MIMWTKKGILFVFVVGILLGSSIFTARSYAQETPTPTATPSVSPTPTPDTSKEQQDLQNKINDLQGKINDLQGQERTLSSQIGAMDNQIKLTELRIDSTKEQIVTITEDIQTATKKIDNLEKSLDQLTKVLVNRVNATYEIGSIPTVQVLLASNNASDFLSRLSYLKIAQESDKKLVFATQQAKDDYVTQKNIFEDEKKKVEALQAQLEGYTTQLSTQRESRKQLLGETQGSEANYQRILAQTKAQLAAFSSFTVANGGASILSNQTVCDDWGCYYNQRDSQWGSNALNNTEYTVASAGCLMTSVAMVYTHYGHRDVTPQSINSVSSNFSGIPAALLKYSITANGVSSQRVGTSIDSALESGPVIVGISYDGGPWPDHFVVLVSGSGGNYKMNDPFVANGHNINFSDHYSVGSIREIDKVVF